TTEIVHQLAGLVFVAAHNGLLRPSLAACPPLTLNQIIAQLIIEGAPAGVRDPVDLCAMAIKDLMGPTVLNTGLAFSQCEFSPILGNDLSVPFLSSREGRRRRLRHDRSPSSIKLRD